MDFTPTIKKVNKKKPQKSVLAKTSQARKTYETMLSLNLLVTIVLFEYKRLQSTLAASDLRMHACMLQTQNF